MVWRCTISLHGKRGRHSCQQILWWGVWGSLVLPLTLGRYWRKVKWTKKGDVWAFLFHLFLIPLWDSVCPMWGERWELGFHTSTQLWLPPTNYWVCINSADMAHRENDSPWSLRWIQVWSTPSDVGSSFRCWIVPYSQLHEWSRGAPWHTCWKPLRIMVVQYFLL